MTTGEIENMLGGICAKFKRLGIFDRVQMSQAAFKRALRGEIAKRGTISDKDAARFLTIEKRDPAKNGWTAPDLTFEQWTQLAALIGAENANKLL